MLLRSERRIIHAEHVVGCVLSSALRALAPCILRLCVEVVGLTARTISATAYTRYSWLPCALSRNSFHSVLGNVYSWELGNRVVWTVQLGDSGLANICRRLPVLAFRD